MRHFVAAGFQVVLRGSAREKFLSPENLKYNRQSKNDSSSAYLRF